MAKNRLRQNKLLNGRFYTWKNWDKTSRDQFEKGKGRGFAATLLNPGNLPTGFFQDIDVDTKLKADTEDPVPTGHKYEFSIGIALRTDDANATAQGRIAIWELTPSISNPAAQNILVRPTWHTFRVQKKLEFGDTHTVRCEIYLDTPGAEYMLDNAKLEEV